MPSAATECRRSRRLSGTSGETQPASGNYFVSLCGVLAATRAILRHLELVRCRSLVLVGAVIAFLAEGAFQLQDDSVSARHFALLPYSMIEVTTPAPTVRPPSRTAKRSPCSHAIGVCSSTTMLMLSPGITISTPSGRRTVPVTSVVRK